jgi:aminoglycoside phosphotransferase (APT) family kinase protein
MNGTEVLGARAAELTTWFETEVDGFAAPLTAIELISGGRSNLTFSLTDQAGQRYVLRRPPLGEHAATAHDVLREGLIAARLAASGVPVAPVVGRCEDSGVIGAPFFVMRFVDAAVLAHPDHAGRAFPDGVPGTAIARSVVDALVQIHAVDLAAVGLESLARPMSYVDRQLKRLGASLERLEDAPPPLALTVRDLLVADAPPTGDGGGLLHGDFKLGNLMLDRAGKVLAVLDWELASYGEPLADLGWLVASWAEPSDPQWIVQPATVAEGFPPRADIAELYADATGRAVGRLDYYVALAFWRWSCINLGIRQRVRRAELAGQVIDVEAIERQIGWQLARAEALLRSGPS